MSTDLDIVDGAAEDEREPKKRRTAWKRALIITCALLLVLAGGTIGGIWLLYHRYDSKVARSDLLPAEPAEIGQSQQQQQENWKTGPLNLLLLGSDQREDETARSDTIMLVHIAKSRDKATIISIPRDSYVTVPAAGIWKGGKNKINAAFAFGGAKLAATTVHNLTGVPLDGAMIANFGSIHELVDAVDGVTVCVPYDVRSSFTSKVWKAGCHRMGGDEAEEFMRQRKEVPGGDFGRMYNQQLVVKAVIAKVSAGDALTNPLKYDGLMVTVAESLTVDKSIDLEKLAGAVKGIKPANITYATVPYTRDDLRTSAGTAVELDDAKAKQMFAAVRNDTIDAWLAAHPSKPPTD